MSAEVGAPHEVTPIELVMLARMGATVMGKGSLVLFFMGLFGNFLRTKTFVTLK